MKGFVKQLEELEQRILGYRVDRKKQLQNVATVAGTLGALAIFIGYLEYMPVVVSALIFRF